MAGVSLRAVVDEMDLGITGAHVFLHCQTGEMLGGTDDLLAAAESNQNADMPQWQRDVVARLRVAMNSPDWVEVPLRETATDYEIMERFCVDQADGPVRDDLLDQIVGSGAFRRFREAIRGHNLQAQWERFRRIALEELAAEWLTAQGIEYGE
jgi:hypothetical protein